jgi:hypothetical protein
MKRLSAGVIHTAKKGSEMASPNLQLTLSDEQFTLTPLPGPTALPCTSDSSCRNLASHRILSRRPDRVELLCDAHTLAWACDHGVNITTARQYDPAA